MRRLTYLRRSFVFHWRTNLAVALGAAVATASLTGALVVGDSMRASLHDLAMRRLGPVDHALISSRFFRDALVGELLETAAFSERFEKACPSILLRGGATHADSQPFVNRVSLLGVDERFWSLYTVAPPPGKASFSGRSVILNEPLAAELGARVGEDVLLRTSKPGAVSTETLLGRRDDTTSTLRLTVVAIIPDEDPGAFALNPGQAAPRNAFVPLSTLQRALNRPARVNTILVVERGDLETAAIESARRLQDLIEDRLTLADLDLTLRVDATRQYIALESASILLEPVIEAAALAAADAVDARPSRILTHLANTIGKESPADGEPNQGGRANPRAIPYSTVAAVDATSPAMLTLPRREAQGESTLQPGEILLNEWAAEELHAAPGDGICLSYYVTGALRRIETRSTSFRLRGVVPLHGSAADPGFIPDYPGVTDTANLADWNPPFPIDLSLVRDQDEAYWDEHRTTPKAFVTLSDGQTLWAEKGDRFGSLTSIRLTLDPTEKNGHDLTRLTELFEGGLLRRIHAPAVDLKVEPVREQAVKASRGTTDFGGLFIGFSFFLIASACMLTALLFRLGVERRSAEIGLLLATGFASRTVMNLLLFEGAAIALLGGAMGLAGASGYAWLMLAGLRTWWSAAVHTPFLRLEATPWSYGMGLVASVAMAMASIAGSTRGIGRRSPRSLLAGGRSLVPSATGDAGSHRQRSGRASSFVAIGSFLASVTLLGLSATGESLPRVMTFFVGGVTTLCGCLALATRWLRSDPGRVIHQGGVTAWARLGIRNAPRHSGRSILTIALVASATFVIVALESFRLQAVGDGNTRESGAGGFALYAESAVPLPYDLNTAEGREALNVTESSMGGERDGTVIPFRLRTGDEASCLSLYRPTSPRILGAPEAMIARGGFRFASSLATSAEEQRNPWLLLRRWLPDGAIPAIGDESAVKWQLHLGLEQDLVLADESGRERRLRFVALLKGSVLQSEIVIAESQFVTLFPAVTGHGFFLIDAPTSRAEQVERGLERELSRFSFDVASTASRLGEYFAVQNTYISTFQMLGGLGLVLGTVGLAAVVLRNVWERRAELALLRALGFSPYAVACVVLMENTALVTIGLLVGCGSAAVAIAPNLVFQSHSVPWLALGTTIALVFVAGLGAGVLALLPTLRASLLRALRAE